MKTLLHETGSRPGPVLFLLLLALLLLPLAACDNPNHSGTAQGTAAAAEDGAHEDEHGDEHGDEHAEGEGAEVTLTSDQIRDAGIQVEAVAEQQVAGAVSAPARIVPQESATAHVGSLVAGRIVRFLVAEGASVKAGTPMAEIESLEIAELKGDYLRARAATEQTRAELDRQEQLSREEIGAQRTLEAARAAYRTAVADQTAISTKLVAVGINPKSLDDATGEALSARIVVRSPIAGVVSQREASLGEYVQPDKDILHVVNPSAVYADAQVPPDQAGRLRVGSPARVRDAEGRVHAGRVAFVAPSVEPESRTVQVRIGFDDASGLRPESFVTAEFESGDGQAALALPPSAVERDGTGTYVYVEREPNTFERVMVDLGDATPERVVVLAGLQAGDRVATTGVFYLKAARQKGELGDHDH